MPSWILCCALAQELHVSANIFWSCNGIKFFVVFDYLCPSQHFSLFGTASAVLSSKLIRYVKFLKLIGSNSLRNTPPNINWNLGKHNLSCISSKNPLKLNKESVDFRENSHHTRSNLKFEQISSAVTFKNMTRSPNPNQVFIMPQCYYFHAELALTRLLYRPWLVFSLVSVTATSTSTGSASKHPNTAKSRAGQSIIDPPAKRHLHGVKLASR